MVHILSEIYLEYGDSIWVIPLAVFALVLVVVVISVMGITVSYTHLTLPTTSRV
mgnify:CR=1 FL=1